MKINGVSVAFASDTTGIARTGGGLTAYNASHQAHGLAIVNTLAIGAYFDAPSSLATTYLAKSSSSTFGSFVVTTIGSEIGGASVYASGTFGGASTISVTDVVVPPVVAAVPEPTAWMMMITGFGLIGMAARRGAARATA
ncbi:PEPxxWA-CTERM sorting domain-containing protein [Polymorphobacter sp. PAMC 29334]|uniref:PEPxxWA-CTERM sorting domain-containing protein n=1 Tax=Polymorphobacter sp. PAMC 29334 TaxID=2862331 RepID=UPI001D02269A|nr:PEPxxWA-CTERM sorting domain-containing protein [Polymorphobacter sp. PAMC 29334]